MKTINEILIENTHKFILENDIDEKRKLSAKTMNRLQQATDNFAKEVYGDDYDKRDDLKTKMYFPKGDAEIRNNANIASGLFAIGNDKLSDDTLIINFTSALGCPSMNDCPITQQACYAVAGENRLKDTRRKNLLVQKLVLAARKNNMLEGLFRIAEMYIQEAQKTKKPIKFIRYNEVGDFIDQKLLEMTARFSKHVRDKYGIMSMAYTAKKGIDPSVMVDGETIDSIIAMNRSREDIPRSEGSLDRNFFGIPMPSKTFSTDPNVNLDNAYTDVIEVSDDVANHLKVETPIRGKYGIPSIPILNWGAWNGGEGYYYVCPCSFWKYNKDKAAKEFLVSKGIMSVDEEMPQNNAQKAKLNKRIPDNVKDELKKILSKIKSPCGTKCAVCHDTEGGVTKDGKENVKNYAILTATHGALASNYNTDYANTKRQGDDSVEYSSDNKHGLWTKYKDEYTQRYGKDYDAPINGTLLKRPKTDGIEEQKDTFNELYKKFFNTTTIEEGGTLKKKSPYHYMLNQKCPKCGGEGNHMYGGLCPKCAKANNIEQQNKV